jgi:ubiquitin-like modifier-activating enzyme ATG7
MSYLESYFQQNATGHAISIPMPGHPIPSNDAALSQAKADIKKLEKLFDEHDAVFLLMDSRESRWLPTVLGAAKGKVCLSSFASEILQMLTRLPFS